MSDTQLPENFGEKLLRQDEPLHSERSHRRSIGCNWNKSLARKAGVNENGF